MPPQREIRVVKIPLSNKERLPDYPQVFPRMPRLYLELLENKAKIKQDLINKEYIPSDEITHTEHTEVHKDHKDKNRGKSHQEDEEIEDLETHKDHKDHKDRKDHKKKDKEVQEDPDDSSKSIEIDSSSKSGAQSTKSTQSSYSSSEENSSVNSSREVNSKEKLKARPKEEKQKENKEAVSDSKEESSKEDSSKAEKTNNISKDEDDLSNRLNELLGDTASEKSSKSIHDKYSKSKESIASQGSKFTPYDKYQQKQQIPRTTQPPPTLAELEAKGQYHKTNELRDINHITTGEYDQEDKKRELIFKFDLLKKSYPLAGPVIPEYTIHSDLNEMQKTYDITVRKLSLDSTVESYKTYLLGGFMVVEFAFGNFLGFDMAGFTQQQIVNMSSYDRLLIELGEKSYVPSGSRWPVELRLLFIIIMNAGFFIVSKMVMRKTGANLLGMVNGMNNPVSTTKPLQKRRMRGPSTNIDEIPDIDSPGHSKPNPNRSESQTN